MEAGLLREMKYVPEALVLFNVLILEFTIKFDLYSQMAATKNYIAYYQHPQQMDTFSQWQSCGWQ